VAIVALIGGDAALCAAVRRGMPASTRTRLCRSPAHLSALFERELLDAVVLRARNARWSSTIPGLRERFPRIPVFGIGPFRPDDGRTLAAALGAGVQGFLVEGVDEPVAGEYLAARTASRQRERELADAPRLLRLSETLQQRTWREVLGRVGRRTTTADLARALGTSREHLSREFAAGGAPNLKRVIDLARIACAADLLRNPGYDVATVARILGFAAAGHLGSTARRIAGVSAAELPRLGPRGVLARFLRGRMRSRI
jgi:transcriptional regulator GlxA family with amidase domain